MKKVFVVFLSLLFLSVTHAQTLQDSINALAGNYKGEFGLYAINLKTGETVSYNADSLFPTASVIKIFVLGKLYQEVAQGKLKLTDEVVLRDSNKTPGSGILQFMDPGLKLTLRDAAWLMINLSDNTAANMLADEVGGVRKVTNFIYSLGLRHTMMLSKIFKKNTSIDTAESAKYGLGVTTPRETAEYLVKLYKGQIVDSASSREMINLMKEQFYDTGIPRFLPTYRDTIEIAHKTGELNATRNDCGIIYTPRTNYVLTVFTTDNSDRRWIVDNSGDMFIAKVSRLIYDNFVK